MDSTFKEEVLELLREAARRTHVEVRFDMSASIASHFTLDACFSAKTPLAVIVAETRERLLQAELLWSTAQKCAGLISSETSIGDDSPA
jgi:hypothetical protein